MAASKKKANLAILFGGGGGAPEPDGDEAEDMDDEEDLDGLYSEAFGADPEPGQVEALRALVRALSEG